MSTNNGSAPGSDRDLLLAVHADATELFVRRLPTSWVPDYLKSRGLTECLRRRSPWAVGYAPASWTWLTDRLRRLGYSDEALLAAGVSLETRQGNVVDRFRDRLIIGVREQAGAVVGFTARANPRTDRDCPKYVNSPSTAIYDKGSLLVGLGEEAISPRGAQVPLLVEGPMDAFAITQAAGELYCPLAACGSVLTPAQADLMAARAEDRGMVVAYDADPAGQSASARALDMLRARGIEPDGVRLPAGADPADLLQARGERALSDIVGAPREPLVDIVISQRIADFGDRLRWVEGQVAAARSVMHLLTGCGPEHQAYLSGRIADWTGLAPETVSSEMAMANPRLASRKSIDPLCARNARGR